MIGSHKELYVVLKVYRIYYRGLVKWYDRSLQNFWWGFDSLIPCLIKSQKPCKIKAFEAFFFSSKSLGNQTGNQRIFLCKMSIVKIRKNRKEKPRVHLHLVCNEWALNRLQYALYCLKLIHSNIFRKIRSTLLIYLFWKELLFGFIT